MATNNLQFQQQIDSNLQILQTQIEQLSTLMNVIQQAQESNQHPLEENSIFPIELLYKTVKDTCTDLFAADFPSLSNFDDVYSCDDCTNTNHCSVYAEIEAALQVDVSHVDEVIYEVVYAVESLDILVTPTIPSIKQPPSLGYKPLSDYLKYAYLERNEKLSVIIFFTLILIKK